MFPGKLLFLLKQNQTSGGSYYVTSRSGLLNSARFVVRALKKFLGIHSEIRIVVDGNSIDKEVHNLKPDVIVLEAIWVTPDKINELTKLYPKKHWIIRIHSQTPFLANEGNAVAWLKEFSKIADKNGNLQIAFNARETYEEFKRIGIHHAVYLPNFYSPDPYEKSDPVDHPAFHDPCGVNIASFGALRPMKNQLIQAVAAIEYAEKKHKKLYFHVNSTRAEQQGESVLKNLEGLFSDSRHELVKWDWYDHGTFLNLIRKMDLCMQVSLSESFNIVCADSVFANVPIVVSDAIEWMPFFTKAPTDSAGGIVKKIENAIRFRFLFTTLSHLNLDNYNLRSLFVWKKYFERNRKHE